MHRRLIATALAAFVLLPHSTSYAWNSTGHRAVAYIAYQKLKGDDPDTLKRVLGMLRQHPAVGTELWKTGGINGDDKDLNLFLNAATFPDDVRFGSFTPHTRFNDDAFKIFHHREDHFVDLAYNPPVKTPGLPAGGTILGSYAARVKAVRNNNPGELKNGDGSPETPAVSLSWIFHQVGDIHQPLHATTRFSDKFPRGDEGGNLVKLALGHHAARELHAFWDNLLGEDKDVDSPDEIADVAKQAMDEFTPDQFTAKELEISDDLTPIARESFDLAVAKVYGPLDDVLDDNGPIRDLPDDYEDDAQDVAKRRVAEAGYRLAAELKALFPALGNEP